MTERNPQIEDYLARVRDTGAAARASLVEQVRQLSLGPGVDIQPLESAEFSLEADPASGGADSLVGTWRNAKGQRIGSIVFNVDGSVYAEYDVVRPHPTDARWFVEAAVAWGRADAIKSELRLLPAV